MTGLFGSTILEVAIAIVFIYLLLAICCTTVNEWISGLLKMRSRLLLEGITQLLAQGDQSTAAKLIDAFYGHPLIRGLMRQGGHPSYLSARTFATAIMDIATPQRAGAITFDDLLSGIKNDLPESGLRTSLLALMQNTDRSLQSAQLKIEAWYDDGMDRVSGWYKRKTQIWTLAVASILIIATNADTIHIARELWIEPALRYSLARSQGLQLMRSTAGDGEALRSSAARLLGEIIGWRDVNEIRDPWSWPERILGWILSIIAVSLGAPFWFDALKRFMNVRAAGRSPIEFGPPPQKPSAPVISP